MPRGGAGAFAISRGVAKRRRVHAAPGRRQISSGPGRGPAGVPTRFGSMARKGGRRKSRKASGKGAKARPRTCPLGGGKDARRAERFRAAVLAHQGGRLAAAEAGYREILAAAPSYPGAALNYALLARSTGRLDLALGLAEAAVETDPFEAGAHATLGSLLLEAEREGDAVVALRTALRFEPGHANARFNLGHALRRAGEPEDAKKEFDRLVDRFPNDPEHWLGLGDALFDAGRPRDAMGAYRRALVLAPDHPDALAGLGLAHVDAGEFEAAARCYRRVLDASPEHAHVWLDYAKTRRFGDADRAEIEAAERAAERLGRAAGPPPECGDVHFALGKMHDDLGDHDRAFGHFRRGNEILSRHTPFDPAATGRLVACLEERFDAAWFERVRGLGDPSPRPVFIVGMPRSGTTLVEQILASHPEVHGAGELLRIPRLAEELAAKRPAPHEAADAPPLAPAELEAAARDYLHYLDDVAGSALRVTDKLPENWHHLGFIASILPHAGIVHVVRDPMDVCVSNYLVRFRRGHGWSYDFDALAEEVAAHERLMRHWRTVLPSPVHEVSYERLTASIEAESRRLLDFCGLAWDDRCLDFHLTERAVHTASGWQVRQPVYRRSVGRWRNYERHLEPLRAALRSRGIAAE